MSSFIHLQKNPGDKSFVISSCEKKKIWIRPRIICNPRLVVDNASGRKTAKKKDCQEERRMQNVCIQVTPNKAALWEPEG